MVPVLTVGSKRVLYIHVPKTGGTSVEHLLRSYGPTSGTMNRLDAGLDCTVQHMHASLLRHVYCTDQVGDRHDFDRVFMTVREPLARLLSEYRFQRTVGAGRRFLASRSLDFNAWTNYSLLRYRANHFYDDNHFRPQSHFDVWDPVVFKLEDGLERVKSFLDDLLGRSGRLPERPAMAASDRSGSISDLGPSLLGRITTLYAEDFERYAYDPPA